MAKYVAKKSNTDEIEKKLNEIKEFSSATIDEFRDTIWALNKEQIHLQDLELKINSFIQKAKSMVSGIIFNVDFSSKRDLELDSEQGITAFRIVQESVNNAIKHSDAKHIYIKCFDKSDATIVLSIADDGRGIDLENIQRKNGLLHMESRVKKIGVEYVLETEPGKGTQISLRFLHTI